MMTEQQRRLAEKNMNLAHMVAWRYIRRGFAALDVAIEPADVIAHAYIGLCQAAVRFDPTRGLRFSTYAVPIIMGAILKEFETRTGGVKVSRYLPVERRPKVSSLEGAFVAEHSGFTCDLTEGLAVRSALETLRPRAQRAVHLVAAGYSQTATARQMGISQPSVNRYLAQARDALALAR